MNKRSKGAIKGIVQGVGFRPFIYQLAHRYHLSGHVINTSGGVDLEVDVGYADQQDVDSRSGAQAAIS